MSRNNMPSTLPEKPEYVGAHELTAQEQEFVNLTVRGITPIRAAKHLGITAIEALEMAANQKVVKAIEQVRSFFNIVESYRAPKDIKFTRDDATMLYMEAHAKAKDATEEIKAIDSLVKLHGIAAPEKREVKVTNESQIRSLPTEELIRLAESEALDAEFEEIPYDNS